MKKTILSITLFSFFTLTLFAGNGNHEDPSSDKRTCKKESVDLKEERENKIFYSSIAGEALFIETVDKHMRPLSCLLRINNENKHHYLAEDGQVALDKNTEIKAIHVFHDSKIYDFVPEATEHNKLTLVLDTKNRKHDLYENRVRKIRNDNFLNSPPKKRMVSCGLENDVMLLVGN